MVGSKLATQRAWQPSPTTMSPAGHCGEPQGSFGSYRQFGDDHPAAAELLRRRRHLRDDGERASSGGDVAD